jgi:phosphoribosylglycinamide formyltransferase-1
VAKLKLGVHISGRGSNLQSLIDACADKTFPAEIVLVISNVADVQGLERAAKAGIPTRVIPHKAYPDRAAFEAALDEAHRAAGTELICNAGFMRIISPYLIERWRGRMLNIHPSLLPAFPGLHTHRKALEQGVLFSGCTVHYMEEALDDGPILVQAAVPVRAGDTEDTLAARILKEEHKAYPLAVRLIAEGKAVYRDGRVQWNGAAKNPVDGILNPAENP